jgi:hypothetical protein
VASIICALAGVAALLLTKGQIAHSTSKILIDISPGAECSLDQDTPIGEKSIAARLIIWQKIVTIHENLIEAVKK